MLTQLIQMAACAHYVAVFVVVAPLMGILFGLSFLTPIWPLALVYLAWCYYDRETPYRAGRPSYFIKNNAMWGYMARYFPISLHKTADLDPTNKCYVLVHHPHACIGIAHNTNFGTNSTGADKLFPGITFYPMTLNMNFWIPLMREYALAFGVGNVSARSFEYKLTKLGPGIATAIVVGGALEAGLTDPDDPYKIILNKRKGFVKIALKTGASLVPVFTFGEASAFSIVPSPPGSFLRKFQEFVYRYCSFFPVIFYGRFLLVPYRVPLHTVVGAPIDVPHIPEPSEEDVNRYHSIYIEQLKKLFDENVTKYGDPSKKLQIF